MKLWCCCVFFPLLCPTFVYLAGQNMVGEQKVKGCPWAAWSVFDCSVQESVMWAKTMTEGAGLVVGTWPSVIRETLH